MQLKKIAGRVVLATGVAIALGGVGVVSWKINSGAERADAYDGEGYYDGPLMPLSPDEEYSNAGTRSNSRKGGSELLSGENSSFAESYDSRQEYESVRIKNQKTEGLCWLYSSVTALEYALAKKYGVEYEVSVKHLDYLTIDGRYVYKGDGDTNVYFDRFLGTSDAQHRTSLGTSGNVVELVYGIVNPLAIMSERDFTDVLKSNDSRLAGINRYEDLWDNSIISEEERDNILEKNAEGYPSYLVRQDYNAVNDPSKVDYVVTGMKILNGYGFDASRTTDSSDVNAMKQMITDYGALQTSVVVNVNECAYVENENATLIKTNAAECRYTNHGITIVGWDDGWEYEYGNEKKYGAYILQNSYGGARDSEKWHLGYISALSLLMYFDSIERYEDYDHYYGPTDYKDRGAEPDGDEYIFELSLGEDERIKEIVFEELSGSFEYDVYVSPDGEPDNYVKDGEFDSRKGISKYEIGGDYAIEGNYAIKLKRKDGSTISSNDRIRNTLNVMARDVQVPDDPVGPVVPDVPVEPDGSDDEEDLPVPNTASAESTSKTGKPNTGQNTQNDGAGGTVLYILPGVFVALITGIFIKRRNKNHRKFDW